MPATARFTATRTRAGPVSPASMRAGRSRRIRSAALKATSWITRVSAPQIRMSHSLTLLAMQTARGKPMPRIAPESETAAATLPSRISRNSRCGVIQT